MRFRAFLLLALLTGSPQEQQTSRIEGVAIRSDNNSPVAQARILLVMQNSGEKRGYATYTDSEGRFSFKNIEPGRYRLTAGQAGFVYTAGAPIDIVAGKELSDIVIRMTPGSVVSGRVFDEAGHPCPRARVQLMQRRYTPSGRIVAQMIAGGDTNDLGEYRLFWIPPGRYYISTTFQAGEIVSDGSLALDDQYDGNPGMFLPTFYPNSFGTDRAEEVTIAAGLEVRGIDFVMTRVQTVRIEGQVVDAATGQLLPKTEVSLHPQQPDWANLAILPGTTTDSKGQFSFRQVPAGTYTMSAVIGTVTGGRMTSPNPIYVGDRNVSGLRVVMRQSLPIKGRVFFEPGTPEGRIGSITFAGLNQSADGGAGVEADGNFVASNLFGGIFRIGLNAREGYFIRSARSGSRNVLQEGIDTAAGAVDPLEIRVAFSNAEVHGTIADPQDRPAAAARVVLMPNSDRSIRVDLFRNTGTDRAGQFNFHGVAPGDYKLFAWEDIEPYAYFDPAFMELYESRGTPVHIEQNTNLTVNLKSFP